MKFDILGKTYSIEFVSSQDLPEDYGECLDAEQKIKVRHDMHPESQADVLLHEVIHAIDFSMNSKMTERQVHTVATGLLSVIYNNPEFIEWIMERRQLGNE